MVVANGYRRWKTSAKDRRILPWCRDNFGYACGIGAILYFLSLVPIHYGIEPAKTACSGPGILTFV